MNLLKIALREIFGLFVDDEFLALATLAMIGITALLIKGMSVDPTAAGVVLLGGCLGVLMVGVWRTARS